MARPSGLPRLLLLPLLLLATQSRQCQVREAGEQKLSVFAHVNAVTALVLC
jgi:hypothetical protein